MGNLLVALVLVLPITAVNRFPDPLTQVFPQLGRNSGWMPLMLGMLLYPLLIFWLKRRAPERLQRWSFCAGMALGFVPFIFYWIARLLWRIEVPLTALAARSVIAGLILGATAAWYVPRALRSPRDQWRKHA